MTSPVHVVLGLLLGAAAATAAAAGGATPVSSLYLPAGRGLDWSFAGYRDGDAALPAPNPRPEYNVTNFGARGDGETDDTAALQDALEAANNSPGVVFLPAGTYLLSAPLVVTASNVTLRGEGENRTVILIRNSLGSLFGSTWVVDAAGTTKSAWANGGAFIQFSGTPEGSDREDSLLANITDAVQRGSTRIPVSATVGFTAGQWVRIYAADAAPAATAGAAPPPADAPQRRRLLRQERIRQQAAALGGSRRRRQLAQEEEEPAPSPIIDAVPDFLESNPVVASALQGTRLLSAGEPGLSQNDTLDADLAAGLSTWSLVWLLPPAGNATMLTNNDTAPDQLQFSARVVDVGTGWIELDRELPFAVSDAAAAAGGGSVHSYGPTLQDSGIDRLTIQFEDRKPASYGLHSADRGYNAIAFDHAANVWVSQVTVLNSENAIFMHWVDHASILDVTVDVTRQYAAQGDRWQRQGHHAVALAMSHAVLVQRLEVKVRYYHDVALGRGAALCVMNAGRGLDLNLHHDAGSYGNLVSDVNTGYGDRTFESPGSSRTGFAGTFWNLQVTATQPPSPPPPSPRPPSPPPPSPRPPSPPPPSPRPPRPPPPSPQPPPPPPPSPSPPPPPPPSPNPPPSPKPPLPPSPPPLPPPSPRPPQPPSPSPPPPRPPTPPPPQPPAPAALAWLGCSKLETDVLLQGGQQLAVGPRPSLRVCFAACADNAECTAFTYVPFQKKCFVKGGKDWKRVRLKGAQSVVIQPCPSTTSTANSSEPVVFRCNEPVADVLFVGGDLRRRIPVTTIGECEEACMEFEGCSAYSFVAAKKACYLRSLTGWRSSRWPGAQSAIVCPTILPGSGYAASPPMPPRPPLPPAPPGGLSAQDIAPWEKDAVPNRRRPGVVSAATVGGGTVTFFPLVLPACSYGQELNFVGRFVGTSQCLPQEWMISALGATMPADIYAEQKFARATAPPVPLNASRPTAADVANACADVAGIGDGFDGLSHPAECWQLVYDHCIPGLTSRNLIPRSILYHEQEMLSSLYAAAYRVGSFGDPPAMPGVYSRVCVANATMAGLPGSPCEQVAPTDYLVHTRGFAPAAYSECDLQPGTVSYVEAHVAVQLAEGGDWQDPASGQHQWTVFGNALS